MALLHSFVPLVLVIAVLGCAGCQPGSPDVKVNKKAAALLPKENFLINLYDAFGPERPGVTHDFGFSTLIRYNDTTILFDSGTNADILKRNAAALGVDLRKVDFAVGSHAHGDHLTGFEYLLRVNPEVKLYLPEDFYLGWPLPFNVAGPEPWQTEALPKEERYFNGDMTQIRLKQSGAFWNANVEYVEGHREIATGIHLIFTRSPFLGYFSAYPDVSGKSDGAVKKTGLPELSLSLKTAKGEVLIVGCSHSLVTTIVEETRQIAGREMALVMGGYHLLPYKSDDIRIMAHKMRDEYNVARVAPAHCSGHLAFKVFREEFGDRYVRAGLGDVIQF